VPESIKEAGAAGALINHSEHVLDDEVVEKTVKRAREAGLTSIVCAATPEKASKIAGFKPDMIALEPPELIGTGISVSKARPEIISAGVRAVEAVDPEIVFLCGAGISRGEDIASAIRLGAKGVLLASGFVRAKNPYKVLEEMVAAAL